MKAWKSFLSGGARMIGKEKSSEGVPRNVKDVHWRPQERWPCYHIKYIVEYIRKRKHIMNYILLSLILIINTKTSIYREAVSDR